ncbi:MAG: hypothetical protein ABI593_03085 [Betaproteobacteria bacterium]
MKTAGRWATILGCVLLLAAPTAGAMSVLPLELDRLIAGASTIVHVRCAGNAVQADPVVGVATVTTFVVLDRARGGGDNTFQLRQAGGEHHGVAVDFHLPNFRPGDEYVLFVPAVSRLGLASPVGLTQGVFGVTLRDGVREVGRGRDLARLLAGIKARTLPSGIAARMQAGQPAATAIPLADFMALVRARVESR